MSSKQNTSIGGSSLLLGDVFGQDDYNIIGTNGRSIKINGVVPSAGGGGASLPITGNGNITITGDITANGDGISNGRMEAQTIKSIDNIIISSGSLEVTTGGIDIKGNGNITQDGSGKITSGSAGIESKGDIITIGAHDLIIGKDIYFDGDDIYHRTFNPEEQKSYKDYKQLVGKNDANIFTGANQFNSNTTEFAAKVSVGTRDGGGLFTQNLALNSSGNIECKTINNTAEIKAKSLICENGDPQDQLVKARQYHFRPNSAETTGWVFSQKPPDNPALPEDNYLMLQNTQATGSLNLVKSSFDPQNPTPFDIILDPQNGKVKTANSFDAPEVNFRKNATDAWSIFQPPAGDANENKLRIQNYQDNAGGVQILDNSNNIWVDFTNLFNTFNKPTSINNTLTVIGNTIINNSYSLLFGAYSFKPIEITYAFTGAELDSNPATLFNSLTTDFIRTNDGATVKLNDLGEGVYILSIDATSSSGGTIGSSRFMCNFPYMVSANAAGSSTFLGNFFMNISPPNGFATPQIQADGTSGPVGSTNYSFVFPSKNTAETYDGIVKITRLSY